MMRTYPYLYGPYETDMDDVRRKNMILYDMDGQTVHKQRVRITLLNWDEDPVYEVEGDVSSLSITKNGTSSVRRTAQMAVSMDAGSYDIEDIRSQYSPNKKVYVEIGVSNRTGKYPEFPILWFPQGVFFIDTLTMQTTSTSGFTLNMTLKDKMCLLNGDVGGKFPATTILDEVDDVRSDGTYVSNKTRIHSIIREVVCHFGGEDPTRVVIEDVPQQIRRVLRWTGSNPLYVTTTYGGDGTRSYSASLQRPTSGSYQEFHSGEDVGYDYTDFVWKGELVASPGDTITSVLDKIKNQLGNYEYYYDVYGVFHFREKRNYVNTSYATYEIDRMQGSDYLGEYNNEKTVYSFSDDVNLISVSVNPQYSNIKNDYIVQGTRKSSNSTKTTSIRYHLVIDSKPVPAGYDAEGKPYYSDRGNFLVYKEPTTSLHLGAFPVQLESADVDTSKLPSRLIYVIAGDTSKFWYVNKAGKLTELDTVIKYWSGGTGDRYYVRDWRTELYVRGLAALAAGTDTGEYFEELAGGWPQTYDIYSQTYVGLESSGDTAESRAVKAIRAGENAYADYGLLSIIASVQHDKVREYLRSLENEVEALWQGTEATSAKEAKTKDMCNRLQSKILEFKNPSGGRAVSMEDFVIANSDDIDRMVSYQSKLYGLTGMPNINKQLQTSDETRLSALANANYFLDFIDPSESDLGEYAVSSIGRRQDIVSDQSISTLFPQDVPDVIFLNSSDEDVASKRADLVRRGESVCQVDSSIYNAMATGGETATAFERIKYELYLHTWYQRTVTLSALPVYFLDANMRIRISDRVTGTYGDYEIKTITSSFGQAMSVTCSEIKERE